MAAHEARANQHAQRLVAKLEVFIDVAFKHALTCVGDFDWIDEDEVKQARVALVNEITEVLL